MGERDFWRVVLLLPALAMMSLASYAASAGCYAVYMNCFNIVAPRGTLTRAMFSTAAFLPFGGPAYAPILAVTLALLERGGTRILERWVWLAPPLYALSVHAFCAMFASAALPHRRLSPDWPFDLFVTGAGYAYLGVTRLAKPVVTRPGRG